MAYKVAFRSSFERDFKKLNYTVQDLVLNIADQIQEGTAYQQNPVKKPYYYLIYFNKTT
jgi:mRNA-degrading endonuclease RelE of RelBE toxin-antitoxin system